MRAPRRSRTILAAAACLGAALAALPSLAGAASPPGALVSCPPRLDCGVISVPIDHAAPDGGRLQLVVSRLRAKRGPSGGALLFLTGGPGQASVARIDPDVDGRAARPLPQPRGDRGGHARHRALRRARLPQPEQPGRRGRGRSGRRRGGRRRVRPRARAHAPLLHHPAGDRGPGAHPPGSSASSGGRSGASPTGPTWRPGTRAPTRSASTGCCWTPSCRWTG